MENILHLSAAHSIVDGKSIITTSVTESGVSPLEIFYELDCQVPWSDGTPLDGNILGVLLYVMSRGKPLVVHGVVTQEMARNLDELQHVWHRWRPQKYQKIEIRARNILSAARVAEGKAICAFSGGVDSMYMALQHTRNLPKHLRYNLNDALLVHGFDVALKHPEYFAQLTQRVAPALQDIGLKLRTIRTNSKEQGLQDWEDAFGLQLAACLHLYSYAFSHAIISSGASYDTLIFPWGSTPVSDHLMSGGRMSIVHDGAGITRTEKVLVISKNKAASKALKVCWIGNVQSENCGRCEKCVRTQLNFLAAGCRIPECFPADFDVQRISKIPVNNSPQLADLKSIACYAKEHNISGDWLSLLERRIAKGLTWHKTEPVRRILIVALDRFGLKEIVKKCLQRA